MFFRHKVKRKSPAAATRRRAALIEGLECRTLMSSVMHPDVVFLPQAAGDSGDIDGFTPAEIRTAYNFDSVTLGSSGAAADGTGQTIALIDAYNDPHIVSDLAVFDSNFSLPAAKLTIVNQTGGSKLPSTNAGWAGEISLDAEWAHAIAPGANLLLVESNSDDNDDLMAGVNYARSVAGVSVISMSWGGSETGGTGSDSQTALDADFSTPTGHQGITFVAAAGDDGTQNGPDWPGSSPNVVSVGGTTLYVNIDNTYSSESGWNDTSGGDSSVESEPEYQDVVQSTGTRTSPDVAYDADPDTGFAVYDSIPDAGTVGWQDAGGTSGGAPQWAALFAITDQGRVLAGQAALNGPTQTLPDLYNLYGSPDTTAYDTYTTYFNNVTTSDNGPGGFGWGGYGRGRGQQVEGYNTITGLGSPHANEIVDALLSDNQSSTTTGTTYGGITTIPATVPVSPVSITFAATPTASALAGTAALAKLELTDISGTNFKGPVTMELYVSTGSAVSTGETPVATLKIKSLLLVADKSKTYTVKFNYPSSLAAGTYDLVASAQASATDDDSSTAVGSVAVAARTVNLATSFGTQTAVTVQPGKAGTVAITITNNGTVTAAGTLNLLLYASSTGVIDASSTTLATIKNDKIKIAAGKKLVLHVKFKAPADLTAGTYSLIASATASTSPADDDSADNTAIIATQAAQ